MPDNCWTIKANTRRELKSALQYEADSYSDAGFIGNQKRLVASLAASAWRDKRYTLPYCLPLAPEHARDNYAYGVFVSRATRQEYLEQED
jgi:hypothetical protein